MKKYFFVAALSLLADVLPHVCKLSRTLQSSSLDFSILNPVKDSCINNIQRQITTPGKYFSEVDDLIDLLKEGQHTINVTDGIKNQFETQVRKPYLEKLIENLNNRFPRVELLSAFSIFNPSELPESESELDLYSETEIDCLLTHYSLGPLALIPEDVKEEWKHFKVFLASSNLKDHTYKELAEFLLSTPARCQLFPNLSQLLVRGQLPQLIVSVVFQQ